MDDLWKKDSHTGEHVDLFAAARSIYGDDLDEWDKYMASQREISHFVIRTKDNQISQTFLHEGDARFRDGSYRDALENFNKSLCFAESGTPSESMAYVQRVTCFVRMENYTCALVDIDLALKLVKSARVRLHLQVKRAECVNRLGSAPQQDIFIPKLSCSSNKRYQCMADVLEIKENEEFGRHIVAKDDIDVDSIVMVTDTFASATESENITNCSYCNKIERNLIPCANCPNVMFCFGSCSTKNGAHLLECGSIFQLITDTNMKFPVKTILMAIEMFPTVDALMEFVDKTIGQKQIPEEVKNADWRSRYALFLKLSRLMQKDILYNAYQVFTTMLNIPKVKTLFDSPKKIKFLMHLTIHHYSIILRNQFRHVKKNCGMQTDYIYDILSLMNHSCEPNLFNRSLPDDISYCKTVRQIWKGEQVFIDYLGNSSKMSRVERQAMLNMWSFQCNCDRCKMDKAEERMMNMKKIGNDLTWSPEIQIVTNCLTLH